MKKFLWIALGFVIFLIALVLIVPAFVDLGKYKARYLPLVEKGLNRRIDVGAVRLKLFPSPAVRISRLNIFDNPNFSTGTFFSAEAVRVKIKLGPLLKGRFVVEEFVLEKPLVNLIKRADGTFNFSDLGKRDKKKKTPRSEAEEAESLSRLVPSIVKIERGQIAVQTLGKEPLVLQDIELLVTDFSADDPFSYRIAVRLPNLKPIALQGEISYDKSRAALLLKDNRLEIQGIDFAVNGSLNRLTSVAEIDIIVAASSFETKPVFQLLKELGMLSKEWEISGRMSLKVVARGPSSRLVTSLDGGLKQLSVNNPKAFYGNLKGDVQLSLVMGGDASPSRSIRGKGRVTVTDGALTNVDLLSKMELVTGLIGVPQDRSRGTTTFKILETEFTFGDGQADFQRVFLSSPYLEVKGRGTMTLATPTLNFSVDAALSPEVSTKAGSGRAATFFKDEQGRITVPLKVTGPAAKPSVDVDKAKLVQKGTGQFLEKGKKQLFERLFQGR